MAARCLADGPAAENPGVLLGAALGSAARRGRDKLTLLVSPELDSFGLWVEQLVAESTGKDGTGIVPVADEPSAVVIDGEDRIVVAVRLAGGDNAALDARAAAAEEAGVPVVRLDVPDGLALGAEMYRWEHATAVAGHLLGVHPFDQPDVQSSKTSTEALLGTLERDGRVPEEPAGDAHALLADVAQGDYVALLVFGDPDEALHAALAELRSAISAATGAATTLGIGPRFLHSTGQLHKGGPPCGVFVQMLLAEPDVPIPGWKFGFADLLAAQAGGDLAALRGAGRRAVRLAGSDPEAAVRALAAAVRRA
jgi:glucose-6-phosphate isomerase/transaldolase/glucose-6-phosphate isomerase